MLNITNFFRTGLDRRPGHETDYVHGTPAIDSWLHGIDSLPCLENGFKLDLSPGAITDPPAVTLRVTVPDDSDFEALRRRFPTHDKVLRVVHFVQGLLELAEPVAEVCYCRFYPLSLRC